MNALTEIKRLRQEKGVSQRCMAELVGLTERQYRRIENGEIKKLNLQVISKLSKILNISIEDIFKGVKV